MGRNSAIEWTHHTFNPWWGCTKVSPACDHCYAELMSKRFGYRVWGPGTGIRELSAPYWNEPYKWDADSAEANERRRVFCASMADVFEGLPEQTPIRTRLWKLVVETPNLDWLLLTKRPQKVRQLAPWTGTWPRNVWVGTTVENQEWAERRIPHLLEVPSVVRFLSVEPLLGRVDLRRYFRGARRVDWVIAGGEAGPGARPMDEEWVREVREQCKTANVSFFFKQWGGRLKKRTGRVLDGRTWDEIPQPTALHGASRGAAE